MPRGSASTNLTGGRDPAVVGRGGAQPDRRFAFVWLGGYAKFEKLMKLLVGVMGFSILVCAAADAERLRDRRSAAC